MKTKPLNFSLDPTGPALPPSQSQKKKQATTIDTTRIPGSDLMEIEIPIPTHLHTQQSPLHALPVTPNTEKRFISQSTGRITRSKARTTTTTAADEAFFVKPSLRRTSDPSIQKQTDPQRKLQF